MLVERLYRAKDTSGNESLLKQYFKQQIDAYQRLEQELDQPDLRALRLAEAKIAQEILSIQDLPPFNEIPSDDPYKKVFSEAHSLASPLMGNHRAAIWENLGELIDALPESIPNGAERVESTQSSLIESTSLEIDLNDIIEHNEGPELELFERAIAMLNRDELEALVVDIGVYDTQPASASNRDFLETGGGEVTWRRFFAAYKKLTGHSFILDGV